jgi:hypothetical protein
MHLIFELLDSKMNRPESYGSLETSWFHYLSLILVFILTVQLTNKFKTSSDNQIKKILLITGLVMIVLEIYKQIIFTYQANAYQWYAFPFQFCSTPMYLFIIYGLNKNEKIDHYLLSFLATYSTFAGLAVMLYPTDVFIETIGINVQTMIHHGAMAVIGLSLLLTKMKLNYKYLAKGFVVFIILGGMAVVLNTLFNLQNIEGTFNMFFINERFVNHLPVLGSIQPLVPHIVFLVIYFLGFSFVATLVFILGIFMRQIFYKEHIKFIEIFA